MAILTYTLEAGRELNSEQKDRIRKAAKRPYTYDPDSKVYFFPPV